MTDTHWTDEVDVHELHEPTVRAIIDTMKRTGAKGAAYVLEAQYRNDQIEVVKDDETAYGADQLRRRAAAVEKYPEVNFCDVPYDGCKWMVFCDDAEDMRRTRRALGGKWIKSVDSSFFRLNGEVDGMEIELLASRGAVCERVVTGVEIKMVPDPEAPLVEKEVDVVEWICPEVIA